MAKKVLCPNCQIWHTIEDEPKAGTFENRVRRPTFKTDAMAGTFPQPAGIVRETPIGLPSQETHLNLPLKQAYAFARLDAPIGFVIGVIGGGLFAIVLDVVMVNIRDTPLSGWGYVGIIGLAGIGGGAIAFCRTARDRFPVRLETYDALLWVEEMSGLDLDGDGEIGEPVSNRVEVEIQEKGIPREIDTLDINIVKLRTLARLCLTDKESFSERTAAKAGISRDEEWVPFRDKLIARRWAKWKHSTAPNQGVILTPKGEAILRAILRGDEGQINVLGTHPRTPTHDLTDKFEFIKGAK